MNASVADPEPTAYVAAVIVWYVQLPDTPLCANLQDQRQAKRLHDRAVPLPVIESALLLASLRRMVRPADAAPLPPIRSLAYFQPVIDELLEHPAPANYLEYLRFKMLRIADERSTPAGVQKTTFSNDR